MVAWYREIFDEDYLRVYGPLFKPERTAKEVEFLREVLDLAPGARILDLCCGYGRHSIELARRGFPVTGYDLSEHLLGAAKQAAKESGIDVKWVHGDMRDLPFESEFDVVINMFTAFGYFESEVENREVLRQVVRALKPGGRFVIDMANRDFSLSNFQARTWVESEDHILLEEHGFDLLRSRDLAKRIFIDKRAGYARRESTWSLRLYSAHELREMIEAAGMKVAATYGALAPDVQLSAKSPRLVMVAERG